MNSSSFFLRLLFPLLFLTAMLLASCGRSSDAGRVESLKASATDSRSSGGGEPGFFESHGVTTEATAPSTGSDAATSTAPATEKRAGADESQELASSSIPAGQLTAGEWRDLDHWDFWTGLQRRDDEASGIREIVDGWQFRTAGRIPVVVRSSGRAVNDVFVELLDRSGRSHWIARTDNQGRAELFAPAGAPVTGQENYSVRVVSGNGNTISPVRRAGTTTTIELQSSPSAPADIVDLMFLVDATGSMGDEIDYLKAELRSVIGRSSAAAEPGTRFRIASTFYRDHGDDYVVRSFGFTTSLDEALSQINPQSAEGGGDVEEAVEEGLTDALENHDWSPSARARLLFMVLDAPPHQTPAVVARIARLTEIAARQGVRLIPVASSDTDKPTEFFLRHLAIATGGTYVFLTNHSGIGNEHIEPTIGEYRVEYLDDLLVRVIGGYTGAAAGVASVEIR